MNNRRIFTVEVDLNNPKVKKYHTMYVLEDTGGGGGGTSDYTDLENKPTINGVELDGNITTKDLGIDNKFKGWYASSSALPSNPIVGDYAYVKGASSTDPAAIYECTTAGSWSDSGRTADTSNVQTFASGEEVNEVHIVNDLTTGGTEDVLSAEMGKSLVDVIPSSNLFDKTNLVTGYINTSNGGLSGTTNESYKCSSLIEIEPNTYYYLAGRTKVRSIRCFASDGTTKSKVLAASTGVAYSSDWNLPNEAGTSAVYVGQFLTPSDAKYVQFGVIYLNNGSPNDIGLYKIGTSYIVNYPAPQYEAFGGKVYIKESRLPKSVVLKSNIVDNLTTEETDKPLSAKQGVVLDEKLNGKVNLQPSINLYDKSVEMVGGYINTSGNMASESSSSYKTTKPIPIKQNTVYAFSFIGASSNSCLFRFLSESLTKMKPLNPESNEEIDYSHTTPSHLFKSPSGAAYAQFTVVFDGTDYSSYAQLVETETLPTEYYPYKRRMSYEDLPTRIIEEANSSGNSVINVANSDKIGFFSNSFLQGYCMLNHHAINNLSMFSDYIMYNYGHSGDDVLELLGAVNRNESFMGVIPVRNWGIRYGVIAMSENDGALYAASAETYYQNVKKLAEAIKYMGGIPILSTEHDWHRYYYAFDRLNREEGYMVMNWGKEGYEFSRNPFRQFWYNYHPATRTAWLWSYGIGKYLDTLPRPRKAIKLFRVRNESDLSDIGNLMYDSYITRAERFIELSCGASVITQATEKNFDRNDLGLISVESFADEYQKIQNKTEVEFGGCALVEIITPYDRNNLTKLNIEIDATGISNVYFKKVSGLTSPLPARRYYAFGVTSGENLLNVDDTITISGITRDDGTDLNTTYTIKGIVNGMLVTTTTSSPAQSGWTNGKTSGSDEPLCNITGVTLHGSYDYPDSDYMERYDKPLGEWVEVNIEDGVVELTSQNIKDFTDYDKVSMLVIGTDIGISDIQCQVSGDVVKTQITEELVESKVGTSLLTATTFTSSDTAWVGIEDLDDYTPITNVAGTTSEALPLDLTNVKVMEEGDSVYQAITTPTSNNPFIPSKLQLKVVARYFPKYIKTDEDWATSEITRSSLDIAKLKVYLMQSATDTNPTAVAEIPIGAWWNEFVFDFNYSQGEYLKLECTSKKIHIAKCDLLKVE